MSDKTRAAIAARQDARNAARQPVKRQAPKVEKPKEPEEKSGAEG